MTLPTPPGGWPSNLTEPVLFIKDQWAVTGYGLECVQPGARYEAEDRRMNETRPGGDLYDWPPHMAEKEWVNLDAFIPAFEFALKHFRPKDYDADRFARTVAEALKVRRRGS